MGFSWLDHSGVQQERGKKLPGHLQCVGMGQEESREDGLVPPGADPNRDGLLSIQGGANPGFLQQGMGVRSLSRSPELLCFPSANEAKMAFNGDSKTHPEKAANRISKEYPKFHEQQEGE